MKNRKLFTSIFIVVSMIIGFIGCKEPELHVHTFATEWTISETHHWKEATCEHTENVTNFAEHSFGDWIITKEPTEENVGSKERICAECNYKETAEIEKLAHTHTFADEWTYDGACHWKISTCEHIEEQGKKENHTFDDITCVVCDYEISGFVLVPPSKS